MLKKLLFIFILTSSLAFSQQTIKGTFSPADDFNFAILYKVTPTTSLYKASSDIKEGKFEFALDSTYEKGMYRIVYALPQEEHNFDLIFDGKEDVELNFNIETGAEFTKSSENKLYSSYMKSMALVGTSLGEYYQLQNEDKDAYKEILKTQKETQDEFEKASEGMIANSFIKANRPYIPSEFEDVQTYITNVKANYFKHIDFNDETLQSSNFLIERVLNYVFGMTNEGEDENEVYSNNIKEASKYIQTADAKLQKVLFEILWMQTSEAGLESTANFVSDNYLLKIAQTAKDNELVTALEAHKNASLGQIAQDFSFDVLKDGEKPETKKLSELDEAERYLVFFWSTTCSHCLEEIPQLKELVAKQEKGAIKVIAIALDDTPYRWKDMTYEYPDFYHVYGEGKWDNEIGNNYNVSETPTYFVLDSKKEIIAKPDDIVAFKKYLEENPIKVPKKEAEKKED